MSNWLKVTIFNGLFVDCNDTDALK